MNSPEQMKNKSSMSWKNPLDHGGIVEFLVQGCKAQKFSLTRKNFLISFDLRKNDWTFKIAPIHSKNKKVEKIIQTSDVFRLEKLLDEPTGLKIHMKQPGLSKNITEIYLFSSIEHRELFCKYVNSINQCGQEAWEAFKTLCAIKAVRFTKETKPLLKDASRLKETNFDKFLLHYYANFCKSQNVKTEETPSQLKSKISVSPRLGQILNRKAMIANEAIRISKTSMFSSDEILRASLNSMINSAMRITAHSKIRDFDFLEGEILLIQQSETHFSCYGTSKLGELSLTNFRLVFMPYQCRKPLPSIFQVYLMAINKVYLVEDPDPVIIVHTKDFRVIALSIQKSSLWVQEFFHQILDNSFPNNQLKSFAFTHKQIMDTIPTVDGWSVLNLLEEYERLKITPNKTLRIVEQKEYEICDSYPQILVVPSAITDEEIQTIANFRSKGRIPTVTWIHPRSHATLSRCSQPLSGINRKRNEADERLLRSLREINPTCNETLYIMDARPFKAAVGNTVMGKGFERMNHYGDCVVEFLNIDNIHAIRSSLEKLIELCYGNESSVDPDSYFSKLELCQWFRYINIIFESADKIASHLDDKGASVLIHCSDGWDRTSQLVSLTCIFLDPFFRTMKGFAVLVEKEWLSFGHKFAERTGHCDDNHANTQRAPIFLQFLDCVHQLCHQYPESFEFNEMFLVEIFDQMLACRFGTFLFNSDSERRANDVQSKTLSIWSFLLNPGRRSLYRNPYYQEQGEISRLCPRYHPRHLKLWENVFCRWNAKYNLNWSRVIYSPSAVLNVKYELLREWIIGRGVDLSTFDLTLNLKVEKALSGHDSLLENVPQKQEEMKLDTLGIISEEREVSEDSVKEAFLVTQKSATGLSLTELGSSPEDAKELTSDSVSNARNRGRVMLSFSEEISSDDSLETSFVDKELLVSPDKEDFTVKMTWPLLTFIEPKE